MNKTIKQFLIPILFIFTVFLYGQDDCPDDLTMLQAPGEGEPGCMDYNDCNDNGAFDLGEPCYDAPPEGDYGDMGDNEGGDSTMHDYGDMDDEGGEMGDGDNYMDEGPMDPIDEIATAYGDHTWLNCEALSSGSPSYWIENDEFATYNDPLCESVFEDFFQAIDADDDGNISMEEASTVWGEDPEFEDGFNENDLNGDGFVDEGEFMTGSEPEDMMDDNEGDDDGEMDPVSDAYFTALDDGADPSEAFEAASNVVYELEVVNGDMSEEEFQQGNAMASDAFNAAIDDGADPGEAWDATMEAVDQMDEMGDADGEYEDYGDEEGEYEDHEDDD